MAQNAAFSAELEDTLRPNSGKSLALIRHGESPDVHAYVGQTHTAAALADIPLDGQDVIAAIPFQQIRERGFAAVADDSELIYLVADHHWEVPLEEMVQYLPADPPPVEDLGFDISDEEYADLVSRVITEEIGTGQGANFVIRRDYWARTSAPFRSAALAWYRTMLTQERGAYWTFAFITPDVALVGASPERHVSAVNGTVLMNPISGTFRHGKDNDTVDDLLAFLQDRKESEELVMVVDEELKMMSAVCPDGGVMRGPFLKPMSRVTHTEYLLEGKSDLDVREILHLTMFAPTVTGSPMENACTVIARYEPTGRGYYSGVLAHFKPTPQGYELDAPIMIRTAEISPDGMVKISGGATLVRHSDARGEALETKAKVSGVLGALGLVKTQMPAVSQDRARLTQHPRIRAALADRNRDLAPFWRDEQPDLQDGVEGTVVVVDCGDDFTTMLAHQLQRMGMSPRIIRWDQMPDQTDVDLVVFGPGPGDPNDLDDPRIETLRALMSQRLEAGEPTIAVCLSHQILSSLAGLPVEALPSPRQGQPLRIDLLGESSLIGFYNTYAARAQDGSSTPSLGLTAHAEPDSGIVHSLTGPGVGSVQGHLESVLSLDGFAALGRLVKHALNTAPTR